MCPKCIAVAKLKVIQPRMFTRGVSDVIYLCEKCGEETKRRIQTEDYRA